MCLADCWGKTVDMRVAAQLTHILYQYWRKVLHMWIKEDFYRHKLHIFVCSLDFFFGQ